MSVTKQQVRLRPVIRVFVSSTFSDMKHERNALAAEVYPRLEQLCQKNGFQFQAIDLRWGVSTEAGLDHRTMQICFDELRRAQEISPEPNFLVLLGDRYGWRPLPEAISAMEFEALKKAATKNFTNDANGEHNLGQGLDPLAVLNNWYRCDENVLLPNLPETDPDRVPLNYILQPRTRNLDDGRDYTRREDDPTKDTRDWLDVQQVLWSLINTAFPADTRWFDGIDWTRHVAEVYDPQHPKRAIPRIARFQASATEQEIWCGALSATNAERHVIAFFREIFNRDDFPIAEVKDFFDRTDSGVFDEAAVARQTALKEAIRLRLGENKPLTIPFTKLKREDGKMAVEASEAVTQAFCDAVFEKFCSIIEQQTDEYWNKSEKDSKQRVARELQIEQDEHQRFGRERGGKKSFVGREAELGAIRDYLQYASTMPLVVHGSSGCGKTALMWRAFEDISEAQKPIIRLIGTTPHSSDLRGLLTSLCQELRQRFPHEGELPIEIKELRDELHEHFKIAEKSQQPLILFLDALDQLSDADGGLLLNWIPLGQLPHHVKVVVSCLSDRANDMAGQPWFELQKRNLQAENIIDLDALSEAEARTLLFDRWLNQAGRTLNREQRECIEGRLASPVCRQPIYLKLLFEEIRLWRSYDAAPGLGESVPAILGQLIERLGQPANHGRLLVERVLGYLTASRHGLAENEILEILFADPDYKTALDQATGQTRHDLPATATRIPIAIWSRLRFDLTPYLTERAAPGANVLTFYHRQVAEWVQEHFVKVSEHSWQPHRRLADYFRDQARGDWQNAPLRALSELPFQLIQEGRTQCAEHLFGDALFLTASIDGCLLDQLLADVAMAAENGSHLLTTISNGLAASAAAIRVRPALALPIIINRLRNRLPTEQMELAESALRRSGHWLCATSSFGDERSVHGLVGVSMRVSRFHLLTENLDLEDYDLKTHRLCEFSSPFGGVRPLALCFHPVSGQLVWLNARSEVFLGNTKTPLQLRTRESGLAFLGDGIVGANELAQLVCFDPHRQTISIVAEGMSAKSLTVCTAANGIVALVVSGDTPTEQRILKLRLSEGSPFGTEGPKVDEPISAACLNEDGSAILIATRLRHLLLYNGETFHLQASASYQTANHRPVRGVVNECRLGRVGERSIALLAMNEGEICCWDVGAGEITKLGAFRGVGRVDAPKVLEFIPGDSACVVATGNWLTVMRLEDAETPDVKPLPMRNPITACAAAADGWMAMSSRGGKMVTWYKHGAHVRDASLMNLEPTALAVLTDGELLVGYSSGRLERMHPEHLEDAYYWDVFDRPIISVIRMGSDRALVACENGSAKLLSTEKGKLEVLRKFRPTSYARTELCVRRIGSRDAFVGCGRSSEGKAAWSVVAISYKDRRETVVETTDRICDVTTCAESEIIVLVFTHTLRVHRRGWFRWSVFAEREAKVTHACLFNARHLLVVAQDQGLTWLEVWDVTDPHLKTLTATELPFDCTCLSCAGTHVVVGAADGLHGTFHLNPPTSP